MKTNERFDGITTFAIDCDEVLRALLDNMVALYNEEFNDNINRDDIKDFNTDIIKQCAAMGKKTMSLETIIKLIIQMKNLRK